MNNKSFQVSFGARIIGYCEATQQHLANQLVVELMEVMTEYCKARNLSYGNVTLRIEDSNPPGGYVQVTPNG